MLQDGPFAWFDRLSINCSIELSCIKKKTTTRTTKKYLVEYSEVTREN